jgi:chemotaxis protein methyltransferase CheR
MVDQLSGNEYAQLRDFLSREFGLFFEPSKMTFLENRVLPFMQKMDFVNVNQLITVLQKDSEIRAEFIDALTTNETWFFRHPRHFDILREDILPVFLKEKQNKGQRHISVWSAGCSIGAEAYSIAITLHETLLDFPGWKVTILGSDISRQALKRAAEGIYTQSEVRLLSNTLLGRYFIPYSPSMYKVKPELQGWVEFEELNLLNAWDKRTFDIVFCRNTMIYFKEETKSTLTERLYGILNPDGYFFTSATETLHWVGESEFERVFLRGEYVYRKRVRGKSFVLYRFNTSSELLKALNLIVKANFEYSLHAVPPLSPNGPNKALSIPKHLQGEVDRMFQAAALKTLLIEELSR